MNTQGRQSTPFICGVLFIKHMLKAYSAIACGVIAGFTVVFTVGQIQNHMGKLEAATITQCEQQDWPSHQHADHVEFCRVYMGIHVR
tara:strand:+ start:1948 stop:2208 length:261 start_codon:yes stop_codon:yes gene_type:complete